MTDPQSLGTPTAPTDRNLRLVQILSESPLFDSGQVRRLGSALADGRIPGLKKLAPMAIHVALATGTPLPSAPETRLV